MPRVVSRKQDAPLDLAGVRRDVEEWYAVKRQHSMIGKKLDSGKEALKKIVQKYGEIEPEKGSILLDLGEPIGDRHIVKLKNQRSDTTGLNEEAAEKILRSKGLWDEMVEMVPVLDTSKVHAAFYDHKINEIELAQMFPTRTSYSFILLDEDGKPVS